MDRSYDFIRSFYFHENKTISQRKVNITMDKFSPPKIKAEIGSLSFFQFEDIFSIGFRHIEITGKK